MKKFCISTVLIFSACLLFSSTIVAQSMKIDWAVKDSSYYIQGLLCDKDSNIYSYGSYPGSFLEKFSTKGKLILIKKWPVASFSIQKIIYDGSQYFYFTGYFAENSTVDGISISCKGNKDGMIGKMNNSGTILWITTFGSSTDEMGYGLCFGPSNNSLILAGSTTDSLVVNNVFVDKGQQSMLIAQFSLSGELQNHKLYDFLPQRDGFNENIGQEIYSATNGNYFILALRQGSHLPTYPDTIIAIREGQYVMKLNPGFDTLWTKYIIGPSDYGSGAGPLKISAAGDPYVVSEIVNHYGSTVNIQRLDQNSGIFTWNESHEDGGFSDIFLEGNTLFTCGTDSATYCPCPYQDYGYQDIKIFNQNNAMTYILKFNGPVYKYDTPPYYSKPISFQKITRDNYGNTFVRGSFGGNGFQYIIFGNDTVRGDASDNFGDYSGNFLLKLSTRSCNTPVTFTQSPTICAGKSVTVGTHTYTTAGTYTDVLTSKQGCDSTVITNLMVNPLPTITTHLNGLVITADQNGAMYQWLDCNKNNSAIAGATNQSFTATINGGYAVLVTLNGCAGTSSCVNVNNIGIDKTANISNEFTVFPNPANNSVTIKFSSTLNNELLIIIKNELGQTVYSESKKDFSGKYVNTIDLGKEAKGIYFVEIVLGNERSSKKIILE